MAQKDVLAAELEFLKHNSQSNNTMVYQFGTCNSHQIDKSMQASRSPCAAVWSSNDSSRHCRSSLERTGLA